MSKITLSVDSTADLGEELFKKYNFEVTSIGVVIGDKVFKDFFEIRQKDIYHAVEVENKTPKTNAALVEDYRSLFTNATANGGSIIHFNVSSKLSLSHENALAAAKDMERVYIVDSKSNSVGTGLLAIKIREMLDDANVKKMLETGKKTVADVATEAQGMARRVDASFIINDLRYLHRGGRVTGLKLFGANLLKIRPSLQMIEDGTLVPGRKFKGNFALACRDWTKHKLELNPNANKEIVIVVHSDIDKQIVEDMVSDLMGAGFKHIIRAQAGAAITTHCGRNMIGIALFND